MFSPKEGDPSGRPYKNLYYFYERNLVLTLSTPGPVTAGPAVILHRHPRFYLPAATPVPTRKHGGRTSLLPPGR
jgi:hypothetical protein